MRFFLASAVVLLLSPFALAGFLLFLCIDTFQIGWYAAQSFSRWLNSKAGRYI